MSLPMNPIYLLADSQLLFWSDQGRPFMKQVVEPLESDGLKAAYVGASNGDEPAYFSIFEAAMDLAGIEDRRMIYADYNEQDQAYLKQADLVLLAGGDVDRGWNVLKETGMAQDILGRYYEGIVIMGISAGAVQLGLRGWRGDRPAADEYFETLKLIPFIVDAHDEEGGWERLKQAVQSFETQVKGIGIPKGGGLIYHPDHTVEPVRLPLVEFAPEGDELTRSLLLPGTGEAEDAGEREPVS